jgi:hypothetical protein
LHKNYEHYTIIYFIPHRKQTSSPLQRLVFFIVLKKVFVLDYGIHMIKIGAFCRENKEVFIKEVCSLFVVNTVLYKVKNLNFYAIRGKYLFLVERSNKHITVSVSMLLTALTAKAKHTAVCSEPVRHLP